MKKGRQTISASKVWGEGLQLCPERAITTRSKTKELKQRQERHSVMLQDEDVATTCKIQHQKQVQSHISLPKCPNNHKNIARGKKKRSENQNRQEEQPTTSMGSSDDHPRLNQKMRTLVDVDRWHHHENHLEQVGRCQHQRSMKRGQSKPRSDSVGPADTHLAEEQVQKNKAELSRDEAKKEAGFLAPKKRKTRGLTMLKNLQEQLLGKRLVIILNEKRQPVGPDEKTLNTFSGFLGTIARKQDLSPLNYVSWDKVPAKERIWDFVNTIFIVPPEGKKWVLKTVGECWRTFKHRVKKNYYDKYGTDEERWEHRPDYITEDIFEELLAYWGHDDVKRIAEVKRESRKKQKNNHTVGRKSFARLYNQIQKEKGNQESLSMHEMFVATRKRKVGHVYKQPDDELREKIARIDDLQTQESNGENSQLLEEILGDFGQPKSGCVRLYGRGVTLKDLERVSATPEGCVESIKQSLKQEMQQKLAIEMATMRQEMKQEMEQKLNEKLQIVKASMQMLFSQFLAQSVQVSPKQNISIGSSFPMDQSSADAQSVPTQQT